jgi:hypothetical protein
MEMNFVDEIYLYFYVYMKRVGIPCFVKYYRRENFIARHEKAERSRCPCNRP